MATTGPREQLSQSPTGSQRHMYFEQQRMERPQKADTSASDRVFRVQSTGSRFRERLSRSSEMKRASDEQNHEDSGTTNYSASTSPAKQMSNHYSSALQQEDRNLTEMAAPKPVQSRDASHAWRKEDHLESDKGGKPIANHYPDWSEQEDQNLTELAAPKPVQSLDASGTWRREERLESDRGEKRTGEDSGNEGTTASRFLTQLYIACHLVFFSILGTLARIGTQWLTFYPGAPVVFSNLWANLGGTVIMGFVTEDRQIFREEWGGGRSWDVEKKAEEHKAHVKVKKTIPLYIGLTVGFCGSYTSFSTFMRDMFLALSNDLPTPINHPGDHSPVTETITRHKGYSFLAVLAVMILEVMVNISGLQFGAHCARAIDKVTPTLPYKFIRKFLDPLIVVLGVGCWIGAIIMAVFPPDRPGGPSSRGSWSNEVWRGQIIFSLVFSPPGCLLRFLLSTKLNSVIAWFPLGTFAANIFGTAVLASTYDLQHAPLLTSTSTPASGGGRVGCQILQGIEDGFCGCLTTVSTWIVELTTLKKKHAYLYGAASVLTGFALVVAIMGGVRWSIGFSDLSCLIVQS